MSDFLARRTHKGWWSRAGETLLHSNEEGLIDPAWEVKVSLVDIETSPILAYVWGLFNQNVGLNQIKQDWEILCACYQWMHEDAEQAPHLITARDYFIKKDKEAMEQALLSLWSLLENSHIIVGHNAARFDNKKIRAKLIEWKLPPPSPYKVYDTYQAAKGQAAFTSNKQAYLTKVLGGQEKLETGGMELWKRCLDGDPLAWDHMEAYCGVDIRGLRDLYTTLRAWDNRHPNLQTYVDTKELRCGTCLSDDIHRVSSKYAVTGVSRFELYRCGACGAYHRGRTNLIPHRQRPNALANIGS